MKDEEAYVAEWLQFYILQGVSKFIIYDNGSRDQTTCIIERFMPDVDIVLVPWATFFERERNVFSVQTLAYAHALCNFGADVRWMAFLDVDEFLFAKSGEKLASALTAYHGLPSLAVPWTNFGPSGHSSKPDGLTIENYTECSPHPLLPNQRSLLRYKSIVDPSEVSGMGTHLFPLSDRGPIFYNDKGELITFGQAKVTSLASTEKLQLNHYFTRSREEMEVRRGKGRVSRNGQGTEDYIDRRLRAYAVRTTKDDAILQFLPELKKQMSARSNFWTNPSFVD